MEKEELNMNKNKKPQYKNILDEYLTFKNTILNNLDNFIISIASSILTQKSIEISPWEHSDLDLSILNFLIKFNKSSYKIEKTHEIKKLHFIPGELKVQINNGGSSRIYTKTTENNRIIRLNKSSNDVCSIAKVLFLIGPFFDKPIDIRIENCCTNNIESVDLFKTTNWIVLKLFNLKNFNVNIIRRGFKSIHSRSNLINKRFKKQLDINLNKDLAKSDDDGNLAKSDDDGNLAKSDDDGNLAKSGDDGNLAKSDDDGNLAKSDDDGNLAKSDGKEFIQCISDDNKRYKFHKKLEESIVGGIVEFKIEKLMKISSSSLVFKNEKFIKIRGLTISNQIRTDGMELLSKTILSLMKPICKNTKVFKIVSNDKNFHLTPTGINSMFDGKNKPESHELHPGYECSVYAESKKGLVYSTINYNNLVSNFPNMKWCKESEIAEMACTEMVNEMEFSVNFDRKLIYFILFYYSLSDVMSSISVKILSDNIVSILEILKKRFKITYFTKKNKGIITIYIKGIGYENVNKK